jgi:tRNA dimethylallyltransferase
MMKTQVTIITGPTACGKTSKAIEIAQSKNGVIINADAMQMYRDLPILTAQPSQDEQKQAEHRLYGTINANEGVNASSWTKIALKEIERCEASGQHPILVGGSGFYIKSLIEGLSPIPDISENYRHILNEKREEIGQDAFFDEFKSIDPIMAEKLKPGDTHRVIRAWEILEATGQSLAHWQNLPLITPPEHLHFNLIIMQPERDILHQKIALRLDAMLKDGALEEVEAMHEKALSGAIKQDSFLIKAHGYRPFIRFLNGEWSLDEAKDQTALETRQYAKRQMTWCRTQYQSDAHNISIARL